MIATDTCLSVDGDAYRAGSRSLTFQSSLRTLSHGSCYSCAAGPVGEKPKPGYKREQGIHFRQPPLPLIIVRDFFCFRKTRATKRAGQSCKATEAWQRREIEVLRFSVAPGSARDGPRSSLHAQGSSSTEWEKNTVRRMHSGTPSPATAFLSCLSYCVVSAILSLSLSCSPLTIDWAFRRGFFVCCHSLCSRMNTAWCNLQSAE